MASLVTLKYTPGPLTRLDALWALDDNLGLNSSTFEKLFQCCTKCHRVLLDEWLAGYNHRCRVGVTETHDLRGLSFNLTGYSKPGYAGLALEEFGELFSSCSHCKRVMYAFRSEYHMCPDAELDDDDFDVSRVLL